MASDETNQDLESFRQQWISDLRSRDAPTSTQRAPPAQTPLPSSSTAPRTRSPIARRHKPTLSAGKHHVDDDEHDYVPAHSFDDAPRPAGRTLVDEGDPAQRKKLVSALDHYEEAMEKEAQGNMGDSLHLYRKAYRMDHGVDRRYREKYFPAGHQKAKPQSTPGAAAASTVQSKTPLPSASTAVSKATTTGNAQQPSDNPAPILPVAELIASFASLQIQPRAPDVEGAPEPPCPIATLPDELLIHILDDVAAHDVADFSRLSLVCKRFAYLTSHEQRVWKGVCEGDRFGFVGMLHWWKKGVEWTPLEGDLIEELEGDEVRFVSREELERRQDAEKLALTHSLVPEPYSKWRAMFRSRPRIRFNGCYISTVNYVRTGVLSTNQATWGGAPIHIVTYYRYLRFFRDGTCISLLTTSEPADVVHNLTKELLEYHRENPTSALSLPSHMMRLALKGRWRLSSTLAGDETPLDVPAAAAECSEGDLYIETEGVGPKYTYRMDMSLRSAGKHAARNNKLVWRGFYSYNKLTDDWGEFQLRNDKPFFWSRVKSYGFGE